MKAHGYAAMSADAPIQPYGFERREVGAGDVAIAIDYCGLCHSDLHLARNEWGFTPYPIILGHEIIGRVIAIGVDVTKFQLGDRVAVGCLIDSCQHCDPCSANLEQHCENSFTGTAGSPDGQGGITQGGFSDKIVVREKFVLRVPDSLSPAAAAPLLCAGITTYSPLKRWKVGAGTKVGIVGIGGLGHIAIKLAKAMGAHVTAITSSDSKRDAAMALGADAVIVGSDAASFAPHAKRLDFILNTISGTADLNAYLGLLKLDGAMVLVGAGAGGSQPIAAFNLESHRRTVAGSMMGGIAETQELLDFCGRNNISCDVEIIKPTELNAAMDRMERGDVRFRFVVNMREVAESAA